MADWIGPAFWKWHTDRVTHGRAEIHELLLANDLRPSRALGQNFVADGNTVRRIVRLAGITAGHQVVEIGAGLGSLTLALVEAGASVTAVEIDRHVLPVLRAQVEASGVQVVEADALTLDWSELLGDGPSAAGSWSLVANLPYNVAVPLVIRVLEEAPQVSSLLVMVQREVGERLAASAGDEAYGAVSVKVAYWATSAVVGRVSASVFIPRPRVESVLVRLDRRPERVGGDADGPGSERYERLFSVVRAGFAHRRKMLRRSLDGQVCADAFDAVGIRSTARAEELSLDEWERLAAWQPAENEPMAQPAESELMAQPAENEPAGEPDQ
jgi:16S rRNA (adenine1518-N6/adenine1519-N6)-dimethyltransferase